MLGKSQVPVIVAISLFAFGSVAYADSFECAFIQEKYSSGKSNEASCSMLPEKVYSTKFYTPSRNNHCKVDSVYSFEDLLDVVVDTGKKAVGWIRHFGLTEEAKPKHKAYLLKEGVDEQEDDDYRVPQFLRVLAFEKEPAQ